MDGAVPSGSAASQTTYDETPYPSAALPQSHPNRLGALARFLGVPAASAATARVLELGCGDGANLLPMAELFPAATFLGIDISRVQVARGVAAIEAAGLKNVDLRVLDLLDFPESVGMFDYIIAYGVYSWVPDMVRQRILAIIRDHLAPSGVAYLSYNLRPGWNFRGAWRELLRLQTRHIIDPGRRIAAARKLAREIAEATSSDTTAHAIMVRNEAAMFSRYSDSYVRHEFLEDEHHSIYFHEFASGLRKYDLQYLSESTLAQMPTEYDPIRSAHFSTVVSGDIIEREQLLDFLRNRSYRESILCRVNEVIDRDSSVDRIRDLAFRSSLLPMQIPHDLAPGGAVRFRSEKGEVSTDDIHLIAMLRMLAESPCSIHRYRDLLDRVAQHGGFRLDDSTAQRAIDSVLVANLSKLYRGGLVDAFVEPVSVAVAPPVRPNASRLMRYQAARSTFVTNVAHRSVALDSLARLLLQACDGTRSEHELYVSVMERVRREGLRVTNNGKAVESDKDVERLVQTAIPRTLKYLAKDGFFLV